MVVIGASAGGLDAVMAVVRGLPADFPAAVFVVIHTGPDGPGMLPTLIRRATTLRVHVAGYGEPIQPGRIYLPPPDWHLLIQDRSVRATHGPRQHGFRPAVDALFFSAARWYGACSAGVVLSGGLSDGTAGLLAIKRAGGATIVQSPEEASVASMPLSALKSVEVDAVLPANDIGAYLVELIARHKNDGSPGRRNAESSSANEAAKPVMSKRGASDAMDQSDTYLSPPSGHGKLTALTCPSCGGALWDVRENGFEQFECHVGHRFGDDALVALEDERTESILWAAVRALKEDAALRRRMAARADARGLQEFAERWRSDAAQAESRALRIRDLIERTEVPAGRRDRRGKARQKADVAARKTPSEARRPRRARKTKATKRK